MEKGNKSESRTYRTVSIPKELAEEVDLIVESKIYGYRSRGEFVVDAVRKYLLIIQDRMDKTVYKKERQVK